MIGPTDLHPSPAPHFKIFRNLYCLIQKSQFIKYKIFLDDYLFFRACPLCPLKQAYINVLLI
jgi:hypothetical protein